MMNHHLNFLKVLLEDKSLPEKYDAVLENEFRKMVKDEVEQIFQRSPHLTPRQTEFRPYKLKFEGKLLHKFFTENKLVTEGYAPIKIMLVDALSGQPVIDGPLSSKKVEIVAVCGHSKAEQLEDWTNEEFCRHTLRERANKKPLLVGQRVIDLHYGIGIVDGVCFTDNSSWMRSKMFRLGAKMIGEEDQVMEAVSTPFEVRDRRGETDQKHTIPSPEDQVWRLNWIGKKGKIHQRLAEHNIHKVKDLVLQYRNDQSLLRRILKVSQKKWDTIIQQATSCCFSEDVCTNQYQHEIHVMPQDNSQYQLNQSMALDDNSCFDNLLLRSYNNDVHLASLCHHHP